jgi:hypothetical protein
MIVAAQARTTKDIFQFFRIENAQVMSRENRVES